MHSYKFAAPAFSVEGIFLPCYASIDLHSDDSFVLHPRAGRLA